MENFDPFEDPDDFIVFNEIMNDDDDEEDVFGDDEGDDDDEDY